MDDSLFAAIPFPTKPKNGQVWSYKGKTYVWLDKPTPGHWHERQSQKPTLNEETNENI